MIGHATEKFNPYIYQFHMAAFFIVSGYTSKFESGSTLSYIYNKIKKLLVPYFICFFVGAVCSMLLNKAGLYSKIFPEEQMYIGLKQMLRQFVAYGNNYVWWMGATWFVPVLFFACCLVKIMWSLTGGNALFYLSSFFFYVVGCKSLFPITFSIANFRHIFIAQLFVIIGWLAGHYDIVGRLFSLKSKIYAAVLILILSFLHYQFSLVPFSADWPPMRGFDKPMLLLFVSVADTLLYASVAFLISKYTHLLSDVLTWLGKRTMGIMYLHFLAFKIGNLIMALAKIIPFEQVNSFLPPKPEAENFWYIYVIIACPLSVLAWDVISRISKKIFTTVSKSVQAHINLEKFGLQANKNTN